MPAEKQVTSNEDFVFWVNGKKVVDNDVNPTWTLAWYLRNKLRLTGTKIGCNEGACGSCTIMLSDCDNIGNIRHVSINACLTPLLSCRAKAVTTVEGVGDHLNPHSIQQRLAAFHGSQCGFCTPGFVMAMYTLLRNNPKPTKEQVRCAIQGNLCRCTGYRPILEALYSFTKENTSSNGTDTTSITSSNGPVGCCKNCSCQKRQDSKSLKKTVELADYDPSQEPIFPSELLLSHKNGAFDGDFSLRYEDLTWFAPSNLETLVHLKHQYPKARLGNTEIVLEMKMRGLDEGVLMNTGNVRELKYYKLDEDHLTIGAGYTLAEMQNLIRELYGKLKDHQCRVLRAIDERLVWFANHHIRNAGSFAGNIATASPVSDLNPVWLAIGATVLVRNVHGPQEFLMDHRFFVKYRTTRLRPDDVITGIRIPLTKPNEYFYAYKQAQRHEDGIAIVNAAFWIKLKDENIEDVRMAFGGMADRTVLADNTTKLIKGRLLDDSTLEEALNSLAQEIKLPPGVPGGMEMFRQTLCLSFFFKFYMSARQYAAKTSMDNVLLMLNKNDDLECTQIYDEGSVAVNGPVGRSQQDLPADLCTTGEALYTDDLPVPEDCAHMCLVQSVRARDKIVDVDIEQASKMTGVIVVLTAQDTTHLARSRFGATQKDTPIFAENEVFYCGQPIAAVVAESDFVARAAARKIKVKYQQSAKKAIVTVEDAITNNSYHTTPLILTNGNEELPDWTNYARVFHGEMRVGGQQHFYLEPQSCLVLPAECDRFVVHCATQHPSLIQREIADCFGIGHNHVVVDVKRVGGGFGGKETAPLLVALPCALAAQKLKRPVKCVLDRYEDMAMTGTAHPTLAKWKLATDEHGTLQRWHAEYFFNAGATVDLSLNVAGHALAQAQNCYSIGHVYARGHICRTNVQSATACRGFGCPQATCVIESAIEDLADEMNVDAFKLRDRNLLAEGDTTFYGVQLKGCNARRCWEECAQMAKYTETRKAVAEFNSKNRHIKRGLAMIPVKHDVLYGVNAQNQAGCLVMIYADGSVLVSHGGVEMGQGLHTQVAQIAASELGVPLSHVHVEHTTTDKVPNTQPTAGSGSTDLYGVAVQKACCELLARLEPVRKDLPQADWKTLVQTAIDRGVSLCAIGFYRFDCRVDGDSVCDKPVYGASYLVYGAAASLVEVDILTGQHKMIRTDIVMDIGNSSNPAVDIGQIEGAFIQTTRKNPLPALLFKGYGLFCLEELKCRPDGMWMTRGPSTYKIPTVDDCPRTFNVKLLAGSSNKSAILGSKAVSDAPLLLGSSAFFALKDAVRAARRENRLAGRFQLFSPATAERIRLACLDELNKKVPSFLSGESYSPWTVEP